MSCLAMISNGFDPATADVRMSANGHISNTGGIPNLSAAAHDLGLGRLCSYYANNSSIPNALNESNYVIAEVPHSGRYHYVLISGVAYNPTTHNCDYTIVDPGSANTTFLSQYGAIDLLVEVNTP